MRSAVVQVLVLMSLVASAAAADDIYWTTDDSMNVQCDGGANMDLFTSMDKDVKIGDQMIEKTVNSNVVASNILALDMKSTSSLTINDAGHIYTYGYEFEDSLKPLDSSSDKEMDYNVALKYDLSVPMDNLSYPVTDYLSVFKFHNPDLSGSKSDSALELHLDSSMDSDEMLNEIQSSIDKMDQANSESQEGQNNLTPSELTIKFIAPTQESSNGVSCIWSTEYVITVPLAI
ncbi:MAG TPA: hypothetical protein VN455_11855 [Methanotrichaceae archaeon]|nr:hypothetical protein [Methanotrichaceae archaeon]